MGAIQRQLKSTHLEFMLKPDYVVAIGSCRDLIHDRYIDSTAW